MARLALTLGAFVALGPLTIDMYLPALPTIRDELGTSSATVQLTLTGTLIGAMFIQTLATTIPTIGIPSETNYLFKAVVVIFVCLLQSPEARAALFRRQPALLSAKESHA